jgi:hypothetical protein
VCTQQQLTRSNTPLQLLQLPLQAKCLTSDEGFEPSEITRKHEMLDENLERTEDGHSNVGSPLRVGDPGLSPPDNTATTRKSCSH